MSEFAVPGNIEKAAKRKKKKRAPISGEGRAGAVDAKALAPFNAATIEALNARVERIDKAHVRTHGYKPSPSLVLDVGRAPIMDVQIENELFQPRKTRIERDATAGMDEVRRGGLAGALERTSDLIEETITAESFQEQGLGATFNFARDYLSGKVVQPSTQRRPTFAEEIVTLSARSVQATEDHYAEVTKDMSPEEAERFMKGLQWNLPAPDMDQIIQEVIGDDDIQNNFSAGIDPLKDIGQGLGTMFFMVGLDARDVVTESLRLSRNLYENVPGGNYIAKAGAPFTAGRSLLLDSDIPIELAKRDAKPVRSLFVLRSVAEAFADPYTNPSAGNSLWYALDLLSLLSVVGAIGAKTAQAGRAFKGLDQANDIADAKRQLKALQRQQELIKKSKPSDFSNAIGAWVKEDNIEETARVLVELDRMKAATVDIGLGKRLTAAMGGVVKQPLPGTYQLGVGALTEDFNLSVNAGWRQIQRGMFGIRQRGIEGRLLTPAVHRKPGKGLINAKLKFFSSEGKLSRQREYNMRMDYALKTAQTRRIAKWRTQRVWTEGVWNQMINGGGTQRAWMRVPKTEHAGVQKSIQMRLAYPELKGPEAAKIWGAHHDARIMSLTDDLADQKLKHGSPKLSSEDRSKIEGNINAIEGEIAAHENQLGAIKLGEEWLERADAGDLPKDVKKLFVATEDVLDDLAVAREALGVLPESMAWRLQAQRTYLEKGADDPYVLYQLHGEETLDSLIDAEGMSLRELQFKLEQANKTDRTTEATKATLEKGEKGTRREVRTVDKIADLEAQIVTSRTRLDNLNDAALDPRLADNPSAVLNPLGVKDTDLVRTRKGLGPAPEGTRYVPSQNIQDELITNYIPDDVAATRPGKWGPAPAQAPPQIRYSFTGRALHFGRYRIDVSNMAVEQLRASIRYGLKQEHYDNLWSTARLDPKQIPEEFRLPIRDSRNISDLQKKIIGDLEEGFFDAGQADDVIQAGAARELDVVIPADYARGTLRGGPTKGGWNYRDNAVYKKAKADGEDIRWIDSRELVSPHSAPHGKFFGALADINGIVRDVTLYARPAYATNFIGAGVMAFFQQGMATPANFGRGLHMSSFYGEDVAHLIRSMSGTSKTASFAPEGQSVFAWTRWLRDNWQEVTDNPFRHAAVISELRKRNIPITREAILDPKNKKKVRESARRARRAMVDFDNLVPFEREWMRHLVFIYSWMTRSTFWGFHTVFDRPIKVGVAARAGQLTEEEIDERIGPEQEWLEKLPRHVSDSDYLPFIPGIATGPNAFANSQQSNTFTSMTEAADTVLGVFEDGQPGITEILSPAAKLGATMAGLNPDGYKQDPVLAPTKFLADNLGDVGQGVAILLEGLPQISPEVRIARLNQFDEPGMPEIGRNDGLRAYLDAWEDAPTFLPKQGALGERWTLFLGSMTPTEQNTFVRLQRKLKEVRNNDPDLADDVDLAIDRLWKESQSKLIAQSVTPGMELNMEVDTEIKKEKRRMVEETGQDTDKMPWMGKLEATINTLSSMGLMTEAETEEANAYRKKLGARKSPLEGGRFRTQLLIDHAEKQEMDVFNDRVRLVTSFMRSANEEGPDLIQNDLRAYREGVEAGKYSTVNLTRFESLVAADDGVRRDYALLFDLYEEREDAMRPDPDAVQTPEEYTAGWKKHRDWINENGSGPIEIDGVEYPSFEEADWIRMPHKERAERVMDLVGARDWSSFTSFQKQALGRPVSNGAIEGWTALEGLVERMEAPVGSGELATGKKVSKSRLVEIAHSDGDEDFPGFASDFAFAEETTLGERFLQLASYATWKLEWDAFQSVTLSEETSGVIERESFIEQLEKAVVFHKTNPTEARAEWKRYVLNEVKDALDQRTLSQRLLNQDVIDMAKAHNGGSQPLQFFLKLMGS